MTETQADTAEEPVYDSPIGWVRQHTRRYLETAGAEGHIMRGLPNLLLTTRGRLTGQLRRTPLVYARKGDRYVLIASNGGASTDPQWYLNLVKDPQVRVQVEEEVFDALAEPVTGDEYPGCWQLILAIMPWCADYPKLAGRHIPLVSLTRR